MGLRFSILGFAQERAVDVVAFKDGKEVRLDVIDLLLLNQIADFPNRSHVMKIIEGEKIFFWIAYTEILGELPILRLKKQALRDRFDKLVLLGLLEKRHNKTNNMTFFRLTDMYETLKYDTMVYDTDRGCVVNDRGVYSDTQGVCSELHTISVNKYNKNNKEDAINKRTTDFWLRSYVIIILLPSCRTRILLAFSACRSSAENSNMHRKPIRCIIKSGL